MWPVQTTGRVAVVTGAGSGIGRAAAELMLENDYRVVLAGRRAELLEDVARGREGALVVPTDVTVVGQVDRLFEAAVQRWGCVELDGRRIHEPTFPVGMPFVGRG